MPFNDNDTLPDDTPGLRSGRKRTSEAARREPPLSGVREPGKTSAHWPDDVNFLIQLPTENAMNGCGAPHPLPEMTMIVAGEYGKNWGTPSTRMAGRLPM